MFLRSWFPQSYFSPHKQNEIILNGVISIKTYSFIAENIQLCVIKLIDHRFPQNTNFLPPAEDLAIFFNDLQSLNVSMTVENFLNNFTSL